MYNRPSSVQELLSELIIWRANSSIKLVYLKVKKLVQRCFFTWALARIFRCTTLSLITYATWFSWTFAKPHITCTVGDAPKIELSHIFILGRSKIQYNSRLCSYNIAQRKQWYLCVLKINQMSHIKIKIKMKHQQTHCWCQILHLQTALIYFRMDFASECEWHMFAKRNFFDK